MTVVNPITQMIEEFIRQQREHTERTLAEIITKYDFIVGSKECKLKLMEILPDGANVICSPYIESLTTIYAVKKFNVMDLMYGSQESEEIRNKMTAEEYRQRMMHVFHKTDCDELIALCVLPTEKEFEHLEWLLKNHYKKEHQVVTNADNCFGNKDVYICREDFKVTGEMLETITIRKGCLWSLIFINNDHVVLGDLDGHQLTLKRDLFELYFVCKSKRRNKA